MRPRPVQRRMDIVDAQIHLERHMQIGEVIAAMDALGIQGVLIDEFWGMNEAGEGEPCAVLPNGVYRPLSPLAQAAALKHPERVSYFQRVNRRDPQLAELFAMLGSSPGCRAVRLSLRDPSERQVVLQGGYDALFALAERHALPVCVLARDTANTMRGAVTRFPGVQFVLDHCGWPRSAQQWEEILALGKARNVWLKWSHPHRAFESPGVYPFPGLHVQLARAIDAYGIERVMWASDFTHDQSGCTWSELLHYCRVGGVLSQGDGEWLFGRAARGVFRWTAPATDSKEGAS